ncbi:jg10902 [Pararge aegeria aegeria]|uniref:Jg10902 protein n=1 Tax=Pararge aegeria aegeria TaxID=348720 RepID=A0A8S4S9M6_9NEOP|nr:jg10902 [Pararge aegeria aegeria]
MTHNRPLHSVSAGEEEVPDFRKRHPEWGSHQGLGSVRNNHPPKLRHSNSRPRRPQADEPFFFELLRALGFKPFLAEPYSEDRLKASVELFK